MVLETRRHSILFVAHFQRNKRAGVVPVKCFNQQQERTHGFTPAFAIKRIIVSNSAMFNKVNNLDVYVTVPCLHHCLQIISGKISKYSKQASINVQ